MNYEDVAVTRRERLVALRTQVNDGQSNVGETDALRAAPDPECVGPAMWHRVKHDGQLLLRNGLPTGLIVNVCYPALYRTVTLPMARQPICHT